MKIVYYKTLKLIFLLLTVYISINTNICLSFADNDQELFLVSQKAFEDGFYDVAIRYINQIFEQYPNTDKTIQAKLLLGQCYFFKQKYLKAYDSFHELLQYNEYKDATLFWLGETYLKGSDLNQAEKQYIKVIRLYKQSIYRPQAYYSLGWVYFEEGKFAEAKKAFLTMIAKYPNHQLTENAAYKLGEVEYNLKAYKDTIDLFSKYTQKYPKSTHIAEANFYIAESYYYLNDPLTAITYYAKASEIAYDNKLILMSKISLGWSYLKLEKYKIAEKYFQEAEQLSAKKDIPSDDVFFGEASLFSETQEYDKAIKTYKKLIKNFPKSERIGEAMLSIANLYYSMNRYKDAASYYKKTLTQLKGDKTQTNILNKAYFGLAWSYLKNSEIDKSIQTFNEIKNTSKNKTIKISAMSQIGDAYQDIEQYGKAIEVYDQILKETPNSPYTDYVQYREGIALLKLGKIESATLSFQSLQANFPDSKYLNDIKYYLAVAYFKKGDWASSKQYIENFIKNTPGANDFIDDSYYILSLSYYNLGQFSKAIKQCNLILKKSNNKTSMSENLELIIAKSYYKLNKIKDAVAKFNSILEKHPKSEIAQESLIWLGDYYLQNGDYDKSIINYTRLVNEFPGSDKIDIINFEIGQAYQAKNDLNNALIYFKKIINPKNKELLNKAKTAIAKIFSNRLDPKSAIETYQSILKNSPEFKKDTLYKIAEIFKEEENYKKAIATYIEALESDQKSSKTINAKIQFEIGDTYEFLNNREKAIEEYLKIPYLYSSDKTWVIKAYLRMARIFEDEEKWENAILTYNKIIKSGSNEKKFAKERIEWINKNFLK